MAEGYPRSSAWTLQSSLPTFSPFSFHQRLHVSLSIFPSLSCLFHPQVMAFLQVLAVIRAFPVKEECLTILLFLNWGHSFSLFKCIIFYVLHTFLPLIFLNPQVCSIRTHPCEHSISVNYRGYGAD